MPGAGSRGELPGQSSSGDRVKNETLYKTALGILAIGLAAASIVLPRIAKLNEHMHSSFLTPEAKAMAIGILLSALVMGLIDPVHRWEWAVVVGLAPLAEESVRMVRQGPGNLWPIAIVLGLFFGLVPSFTGAALSLV